MVCFILPAMSMTRKVQCDTGLKIGVASLTSFPKPKLKTYGTQVWKASVVTQDVPHFLSSRPGTYCVGVSLSKLLALIFDLSQEFCQSKSVDQQDCILFQRWFATCDYSSSDFANTMPVTYAIY